MTLRTRARTDAGLAAIARSIAFSTSGAGAPVGCKQLVPGRAAPARSWRPWREWPRSAASRRRVAIAHVEDGEVTRGREIGGLKLQRVLEARCARPAWSLLRQPDQSRQVVGQRVVGLLLRQRIGRRLRLVELFALQMHHDQRDVGLLLAGIRCGGGFQILDRALRIARSQMRLPEPRAHQRVLWIQGESLLVVLCRLGDVPVGQRDFARQGSGSPHRWGRAGAGRRALPARVRLARCADRWIPAGGEGTPDSALPRSPCADDPPPVRSCRVVRDGTCEQQGRDVSPGLV